MKTCKKSFCKVARVLTVLLCVVIIVSAFSINLFATDELEVQAEQMWLDNTSSLWLNDNSSSYIYYQYYVDGELIEYDSDTTLLIGELVASNYFSDENTNTIDFSKLSFIPDNATDIIVSFHPHKYIQNLSNYRYFVSSSSNNDSALFFPIDFDDVYLYDFDCLAVDYRTEKTFTIDNTKRKQTYVMGNGEIAVPTVGYVNQIIFKFTDYEKFSTTALTVDTSTDSRYNAIYNDGYSDGYIAGKNRKNFFSLDYKLTYSDDNQDFRFNDFGLMEYTCTSKYGQYSIDYKLFLKKGVYYMSLLEYNGNSGYRVQVRSDNREIDTFLEPKYKKFMRLDIREDTYLTFTLYSGNYAQGVFDIYVGKEKYYIPNDNALLNSASIVNEYFPDFDKSKSNIYKLGVSDGINEAEEFSVYKLMFAVFDSPLSAIAQHFNFTVFGINIAGALFALLTLFSLILIFKVVKKFI